MLELKLNIAGMSCASCAARIESALKKLDGVVFCSVNAVLKEAFIKLNSNETPPNLVCDTVRSLGFQPTVLSTNEKYTQQENEPYKLQATLSQSSCHNKINENQCPAKISSDSVATLNFVIGSNLGQNSEHCFLPKRTSSILKSLLKVLLSSYGVVGVQTETCAASSLLLSIIYKPHIIGARELSSIVCQHVGNLDAMSISHLDVSIRKSQLEYEEFRCLFSCCIVPAVFTITLLHFSNSVTPQLLLKTVAPNVSIKILIVALLTTFIHLYGGATFHTKAFKALKNRYVTMDLLLSISTNVTYWFSLLALLANIIIGTLHMNSLYFLSIDQYFFGTPTVLVTSLLFGKFIETKVNCFAAASIKLQPTHTSEKVMVLMTDSEACEKSPLWSSEKYHKTYPTSPLIENNDLVLEMHAVINSTESTPRRLTMIHMNPALLHIGDVVQLSPGSIVPADGSIQHCFSAVSFDESILTGESMPVRKQKGSHVIQGSELIEGYARILVTEIGSHTYIGRIEHMMNVASSHKYRKQILADEVTQWFGPLVLFTCFVTVLSWTVLTMFGLVRVPGGAFSHAIFIVERGISVIAIACPCVIGLATPIAIALAVGYSAKNKLLVKNANALEQAASGVTDVVLDKTGTLTEGNMKLVRTVLFQSAVERLLGNSGHNDSALAGNELANIEAIKNYLHTQSLEMCVKGFNHTSDKNYEKQIWQFFCVLRICATLQLSSTHPLSKALVRVYTDLLEVFGRQTILRFPSMSLKVTKEIPGEGIICYLTNESAVNDTSDYLNNQEFTNGTLQPLWIAIGSQRMLKRLGVAHTSGDVNEIQNAQARYEDAVNTETYLFTNMEIIGMFVFSDKIRTEASEFISALQKRQITPWMCTGDSQTAALLVSRKLGIPMDNVMFDMKPGDKLDFLRKQVHGDSLRRIVMVGDGVNDAPALSFAHIGIAFNTKATLLASAADVICVHANLRKIVEFLDLSKHTAMVINSNYLWAICFNFVGVALAAGLFYPHLVITPAISGFLMAFSSLFVVINSLRVVLFFQSIQQKQRHRIFNIGYFGLSISI